MPMMMMMMSTTGSMPRPMKKLRIFIVFYSVCLVLIGELCLESLVLFVEKGAYPVRNAVPVGKVLPGAPLHILDTCKACAVACSLLRWVHPSSSAVPICHDDDREQVPHTVFLYRITVRHMPFIHFHIPHVIHILGGLCPTAASPRILLDPPRGCAGCV